MGLETIVGVMCREEYGLRIENLGKPGVAGFTPGSFAITGSLASRSIPTRKKGEVTEAGEFGHEGLGLIRVGTTPMMKVKDRERQATGATPVVEEIEEQHRVTSARDGNPQGTTTTRLEGAADTRRRLPPRPDGVRIGGGVISRSGKHRNA